MDHVEPGRGPAVSDGVSLWVDEAGDGPPLLLIAGLGYASWCWHDLRERLSGDFRVIHFDNRGSGRSDKPRGPYSLEQMVDDALRVLDARGVEQTQVLGHSMGGYIALHLAKRAPERVRAMVLVGTSAGGPEHLPAPPETMATWQQAGALAPRDYARMSMPHSFAPGWTARHPERFEALIQMRLEHPTPTPCWLAQFQACIGHITDGLDVRDLRVPTLVVHGEADCVVPWPNGQRLARQVPDAQWRLLPGIGHLPFFEDPDCFADTVRGFLVTRARAA